MTWNSSNSATLSRLATALGVAAALLGVAAGGADAQTASSPAGTWVLNVTLTDCTSGSPLGPSFPSLVTYHADGTVTETPGSSGFAPGQRAPGHGKWNDLGGSTFNQRIVALVLFDTPANLPGTPGYDPSRPVSPGFFAGGQTITQTPRIEANALTSTGTVTFYRLVGGAFVPYRTGCSRATGWRYQ